MKNVVLLMMILISIFGLNRVDALTINSNYIQTNASDWTLVSTYYYQDLSNQKGLTTLSFPFTTNLSKGNEYMIISAYASLWDNYSLAYVSFDNVDFDMTCSNSNTSYYDNNAGTIYYQDGSHADIDFTLWTKYCNNYEIENGSIISGQVSTEDLDLHPTLNVIVRYASGSSTTCEQTGSTFKCPLRNADVSGLYIRVINGGKSASYRVYVDRYGIVTKGQNEDIISSINTQNQQQHTDSQNTQQKIDDVKNTIKDDNIDSPNSTTSSWSNMNASNGTITNLLTLPIQLMQGYVNGMNSSCTPFNLGTIWGHTLTLPCINVGSLIGSALWTIIDVLFSGFMIFAIAKKLIKVFNDFTNMKSNQVDELYGGGA